MFIRQGLNPFTRKEFDLFNWGALESMMHPSTAPGVALVPTHSPRISKIGGVPEFVDSWPEGPSGPLPFICQLDLGELAAQAGRAWPTELPGRGIASLFFDESAPFSNDASDRKHFALVLDLGTRRRPTGSAHVAHSYSPVMLEIAAAPPSSGPMHQVGGAPKWIQAPWAAPGHYLSGAYLRYPGVVAALEKVGVAEDVFLQGRDNIVAAGRRLDAAGIQPGHLAEGLRDWRLLFQIDADETAGMLLGDMGRIHLFADPQTLQPGSAPLAWAELQDH